MGFKTLAQKSHVFVPALMSVFPAIPLQFFRRSGHNSNSDANPNSDLKPIRNGVSTTGQPLNRATRLESSAGALTNFEVLDFLRSRGAGKDPTRVIASVSSSEFKVFDYLEQTPACNQTREIIHKFVDECKKYDLAKAEILNIANIRPSSPVEAYTIIEECDSRLDDKIEEFVDAIVQILPPQQPQLESIEENLQGNEESAEPQKAETTE